MILLTILSSKTSSPGRCPTFEMRSTLGTKLWPLLRLPEECSHVHIMRVNPTIVNNFENKQSLMPASCTTNQLDPKAKIYIC